MRLLYSAAKLLPLLLIVQQATIAFAQEQSAVCSAESMMSVVRGSYWEGQQAANSVLSSTAFNPLTQVGGQPVRMEFVRPAENYVADFEPQPGLHPQESVFHISGLISDGGAACTEPIGVNGMRQIISEASEDPQAFEAQGEEAGRILAERISQMSPEEIAAMREDAFAAISRIGTPGQGGESALAMGEDALAEAMGTPGDRPVLIKLFSPNAFAWQSDFIGAGRNIEHGGIGAWASNSEAQVVLELVDKSACELRVSEEPEPIRMFTWAPDSEMPLYARWEGEESPIAGSSQGEMLQSMAFDGTYQRLNSSALNGEAWVTVLDGKTVGGNFELTGPATLTTITTEFALDPQTGEVEGDRVVDQDVRTEQISVSGYFNAPSMVEFDRAGRTITRALQVCPVVDPPAPGTDRPTLPGTRDPILLMDTLAFAQDQEAQRSLFEMAQRVRDRQQSFGERLLDDLQGDGEVVSILKRPTEAAFINGVLAKARRNNYEYIGQMDDMVRGRFDLDQYCDVHGLAHELLWELPTQAGESGDPFVRLDKTETPRRPVDAPACQCQGYGYPRYHVIVQDSETGITHEWQIGNEAVSRVYEMHGVALPPGMDLDFEAGHIGADLHDIDYDIFRQGVKRHDPAGYEEMGLAEFGQEIDVLSAEAACQGDELPDLDERIQNVQDTASRLLHDVVDHYGLEQVRQWYH